MAKRKFQLTDKEQNTLLGAFQAAKDGSTRTRYQAVRLYGTGYAVDEIIQITGCSRTSLMDWCRAYRAQAPDPVGGALADHRVGGNRAKLTVAQLTALKERLRTYTPADLFGAEAASPDGAFWTVEDLARAIQQWYGVVYQRGSYYELLHRLGFSVQRPAKVFRSRSEAEVLAFESALEKNC
jgi:transposase